MVARDGIEPPTPAFSGPRSTTELPGLSADCVAFPVRDSGSSRNGWGALEQSPATTCSSITRPGDASQSPAAPVIASISAAILSNNPAPLSYTVGQSCILPSTPSRAPQLYPVSPLHPFSAPPANRPQAHRRSRRREPAQLNPITAPKPARRALTTRRCAKVRSQLMRSCINFRKAPISTCTFPARSMPRPSFATPPRMALCVDTVALAIVQAPLRRQSDTGKAFLRQHRQANPIAL